MGSNHIRKNNIGRALVRFLIGAIILAALVIVIKEFWLKKDNKPSPTDKTGTNEQLADNQNKANNPTPLGDLDKQENDIENITDDQSPADTGDEHTNDDNFDEGDEGLTDEDGFDATQDGDETDFGDDEGDGFDLPDDSVNEPTPTPTLEPTPTPAPTATPMPANLYAARITDKNIANIKNWKTDKKSRIENGVSDIHTVPGENGGHILSITGWSFGTYLLANSYGWDGNSNTTYVTVTNEKKQVTFYAVTVSEGITGIEHSTPKGKNMEKADFVCNIDVSAYPDGTYSLGTANYFIIKRNGTNNKFHHAYSLGDAYKFTVVGGYVTSLGGVENN